VKPDQKIALGPLIALHRCPPLRWREAILWLVFCLFAILIPLLYGFTRYQIGYTKFGPAAATLWSRPWYLLSVIFLIVCGLLLFRRLRLIHRYVAVHQKGLNLALDQAIMYRWEQLAGISISIEQFQFLNLPFHPRYHAVLYPNIGKPIALYDTLQDYPELLTQIKAKLYPRLLPGLKASFEAGQWAYFGPVAINRETFKFKQHPHPWSEIKRLTVERGVLVVELKNRGHLRLPVSQIPNLEILLQLIHLGVPT
jgi:hypothetical protein